MRHALIVAFFGRVHDRFSERGSPLPIDQKLDHAAAVAGVEGAEIIYPDECTDPERVSDGLARTGLAVSAINVNLKGLPLFRRGAICSSEASVRRKALDLVLEAKAFACRVGAGRLTCAPLSDGVDYFFHHDYGSAWKRAVDFMRTALDEGPTVPIHLENKPADPRVRGLLNSSESVLRLIADVERRNVGITLNVGHASIDGVSPAECLSHVLRSGVPLYIHFCDAAGAWDWDLIAGSYHFWNFCEFVAALVAGGYDGWLTDDTFPIRGNAHELFATNIRRTSLIAQNPCNSEMTARWLPQC
jgi:xylose isomerase